ATRATSALDSHREHVRTVADVDGLAQDELHLDPARGLALPQRHGRSAVDGECGGALLGRRAGRGRARAHRGGCFRASPGGRGGAGAAAAAGAGAVTAGPVAGGDAAGTASTTGGAAATGGCADGLQRSTRARGSSAGAGVFGTVAGRAVGSGTGATCFRSSA